MENPKDAVGSNKIPVHLFPEAAIVMGSLANLDGALKYGRGNWREYDIRYSEYLSALRRHVAALAEGEDDDPDSGLNHLCHVIATAGILADAMASGNLIDDRNHAGGFWREFVNKMTPHVKRLREKHADKSPKHWTIQDAK